MEAVARECFLLLIIPLLFCGNRFSGVKQQSACRIGAAGNMADAASVPDKRPDWFIALVNGGWECKNEK
ncbi:hypothetical protein [Akkermansia sp.]|uniref:hypothetical protein n=1 Tax=Akkermansia sp. TaxID=1872421 RepID=UPI0025C48027|nr:hypothetical protein [Akkermansia sp.]MCD8271109.1 hypothetical protein [Akkermansia sp.]